MGDRAGNQLGRRALRAGRSGPVQLRLRREQRHPFSPASGQQFRLGQFTHNNNVVSFTSLSDAQTIDYNGAQYSFFLDNFVTESGDRVEKFMTEEGKVNTALLVGSFRDITTGPPVSVPVLTGARRREQDPVLAA